MIRLIHVLVTMTISSSAIGRALIHERSTISCQSSYWSTCQTIAASVSGVSKVYDFGSDEFSEDISHWASSSTQIAACSFEPGTPEDVGVALRILSRTRTPFAVKGGGHATNPGFSSTEGIQIAMSRFSDVVYDSAAQTAMIGAGLIWDDVYAALEAYGVNVVGGRVPGIGVAGLTLGGGYSWLTNQHGLTVDTVQAYELVVPNGTVVNVTETSNPDLFFALKGGMNNFGIVTRFTLKTYPQAQVWGGILVYTTDVLDQLNLATANFAENNTDPKAAIIMSYSFVDSKLQPNVLVFYDAPTPPTGIFDELLAIPMCAKQISTYSFSSFIQSIPGPSTAQRAVYNSLPMTSYSVSSLESILNETIYWANNLPGDVSAISYVVEPFLSTLFAHNTTPSAYPPDRTQALFPTNIFYEWQLPESDEAVYDAMRTTVRTLVDQVGTPNAAVYPNYAIFGTPLVDLYGANLPRLRAIKGAIDPEDVMGLAGGFKL